jgi:hypothetical protein
MKRAANRARYSSLAEPASIAASARHGRNIKQVLSSSKAALPLSLKITCNQISDIFNLIYEKGYVASTDLSLGTGQFRGI